MGASLLALLIAFYSLLLLQLCHSSFSSLPIGAHPLDEKFYESEVIKCKDGPKSFTRDRINDNFCDCLDGSDEPGTSACPAGRFYCKNVGSTPQFLYSSRVNDRICDCCDGSDEYDGTINCPNTCIMGGNFAYRSISYDSTIRHQNSFGAGRNKLGLNAKESTEKLRGSFCCHYCGLLGISSVRQVWKTTFPLNNSGEVCAKNVPAGSAL